MLICIYRELLGVPVIFQLRGRQRDASARHDVPDEPSKLPGLSRNGPQALDWKRGWSDLVLIQFPNFSERRGSKFSNQQQPKRGSTRTNQHKPRCYLYCHAISRHQYHQSVANLYMEDFEEQTLTSTPCMPKIWKRYVDDTFTILSRDKVGIFLQQASIVNNQRYASLWKLRPTTPYPFLTRW